MSDMFVKVGIGGDAGVRQCQRCGALVGGWSMEIGNGEWRHQEWHDTLDAALRRTAKEEAWARSESAR